MARDHVVETRKDRIAVAHGAGMGTVSLGSVLAGVLVAFGAFAVIAAIAGAVLHAVGVNTDSLTTNDWRNFGIGTAVVAAAVLFISYLWGGYVAGRMARRAGAVNGLIVFVLSLLIAGAVGAAVGSQADTSNIMSNLRSIGVPTSSSQWAGIGTAAGIASLLVMLLGSVFGGMLGERWHGKLMARAVDPDVGPGVVVPAGARGVGLRDEGDARDREVVTGEGRHELDTSDREIRDREIRDREMARTSRFDDTSTTLEDDLAARRADD